jgi:hypothetical protein
MRYLLQRHPLPVTALFDHSLVLTYALPSEVLSPLLPPGLELDTYGPFGFLAVAMVQTQALRPSFLPPSFGQEFFLAGYRIFARFRSPSGRLLRGLRILRSDANRRIMVWGGNLLTHYQYRLSKASLVENHGNLDITISTPRAEADVQVTAHVDEQVDAPPPGSPFQDLRQARRFAGPLPFTFDYEEETHSIIAIEAVRQGWHPRPVRVEVHRMTFLERPPFNQARAVLANAFHIRGIPYRWERGTRFVLPKAA